MPKLRTLWQGSAAFYKVVHAAAHEVLGRDKWATPNVVHDTNTMHVIDKVASTEYLFEVQMRLQRFFQACRSEELRYEHVENLLSDMPRVFGEISLNLKELSNRLYRIEVVLSALLDHHRDDLAQRVDIETLVLGSAVKLRQSEWGEVYATALNRLRPK